jgi:hypothetical protein
LRSTASPAIRSGNLGDILKTNEKTRQKKGFCDRTALPRDNLGGFLKIVCRKSPAFAENIPVFGEAQTGE